MGLWIIEGWPIIKRPKLRIITQHHVLVNLTSNCGFSSHHFEIDSTLDSASQTTKFYATLSSDMIS